MRCCTQLSANRGLAGIGEACDPGRGKLRKRRGGFSLGPCEPALMVSETADGTHATVRDDLLVAQRLDNAPDRTTVMPVLISRHHLSM